jgi:hypothetical protein
MERDGSQVAVAALNRTSLRSSITPNGRWIGNVLAKLSLRLGSRILFAVLIRSSPLPFRITMFADIPKGRIGARSSVAPQ